MRVCDAYIKIVKIAINPNSFSGLLVLLCDVFVHLVRYVLEPVFVSLHDTMLSAKMSREHKPNYFNDNIARA